MRVLNIGLDKKLLIGGSDSQRRFIEYGRSLESLDAVVFTLRKFNGVVSSGNISIVPTNSISRFFYLFDAIIICRRLIRDRGIDIIVAQDPIFTGLAGYILAKIIFKKKLLVGVYGNNVYDPRWRGESCFHRVLAILGSFVLRKADAIQADGQETVETLKRIFPQKVFWKPILPPEVDIQVRDAYDENDTVKVIFIGRMVPQKNISMLVEVIDIIMSKHLKKKVVFTIVGEGLLLSLVENKITQWGSGRVNLMGNVSSSELMQILSAQDILMLVSLYEGLPRVFLAAARLGVPIVTTDVSGIRGLIVDGESGYIIDQEDVDSFASKLEILINDGDLRKRMATSIRANYRKSFYPGITEERQMEIFNFLNK